MSRTYWIARALRSFGYAGLIVCGWVAIISLLNSNAEPPPSNGCTECCWGLAAPTGPEALSFYIFLYIGAASLAAIAINSWNALDHFEMAQAAGKPPDPGDKTAIIETPAPTKLLFSDFQAEFPPMTSCGWYTAGILAIFIPIPFSPALFVISQASTHQLRNYLLFRPDESQMLGPAVPVFDGLLWVWFGLLLMAGAVMLAGHVFQCFSMARLAKSTPLHSPGTGMERRA